MEMVMTNKLRKVACRGALTILLLCGGATMWAQQLPQQVKFQELGLAFDIPDGWLGQLDGDYILLGSHTEAGLMIVFENTSASALELKQIAEQGFEIKGAYLDPIDGPVIKSPKRVEGMFQGMFNTNMVKCYAIGLINSLGSGLTILMLAKEDVFTKTQKEAANQLASSVRFFQPKDSKLTRNWKDRITGKQLKYIHTSGGYDINGSGSSTYKDVTIDLCSNGQFVYYSNTNISFDTGEPGMDTENAEVFQGSGYSDATDESQGTFMIYSVGEETFLELTFENGKVDEYDLSYASEDAVWLDDIKHFIVPLESCD